MLLHVAVHSLYVFETETCCQYGNLDTASQLWVYGESPLQLEVISELLHEVVHIVHLIHGQTRIVLLLACEGDAQQDLLGVEYIVVVEQW